MFEFLSFRYSTPVCVRFNCERLTWVFFVTQVCETCEQTFLSRLIAWTTVVLLSYLFGILDFQYFPLKQFWTLTKHQILKFECAKLHALRALMPMHLTHHWYVPYAPAHLHAKPIINMHLTYHLYVPAHLYPHQYLPLDKYPSGSILSMCSLSIV